ncbi:hypothetical protein CFP65_6441 [Kitasatospora sp. MMS16-BH015]|uniref:hypothetical protein n=1 Tax=Kitasatospora sp. MMS16-BH015 TaxID=2018025 RepID=UPI000CA38777|nr:hypothetical protein [Kitasatospora sp. MMS16-BH015]AUG81097.1 hypothetical protein CFP65_6441 [Kitasatospora sp. MMS16-BH015]
MPTSPLDPGLLATTVAASGYLATVTVLALTTVAARTPARQEARRTLALLLGRRS